MLKKIALALAVLVLAFVAYVALQPSDFRVTRSATIQAPARPDRPPTMCTAAQPAKSTTPVLARRSEVRNAEAQPSTLHTPALP